MMKTTLKILDQVNVKFEGLDPLVRRKITEALKFEVPYARHTPQFKMGRWDGTVSYATVGGGSYLNLLNEILPIVLEAGYDVDIDDQRPEWSFEFPPVSEDMVSDRKWPEGHPMAGEPIMLRDYQVDAIKTFTENTQSIQQLSTGAGKTLTSAVLSKICEPYGRSIVIVPNRSLVEQTEEDYRNLGLDVGVFFGGRQEFGHMHTICTWQSLDIFAKKTRRDEVIVSIDDFIEGVVCIQIDECHTAKANSLKSLLAGPFAHIPIRWGFTGTVPKEAFEFYTLLSCIGPVVGAVTAKELQDKGVLANLDIEILQLVEDQVEFPDWSDEVAYLSSDKKRLQWIAEKANELALEGNTLVLVDRIEAGKYLQELIPDSVFIHGAVKTKDRRKEFKEIQTTDNKVLIATYGTASTGINIPRLFNLILCDSGRSYTKIIQSVGRLLRKAKDKDYAKIYDICSTLKYSVKHLTKRKSYYKEAQYPFTIKKVSYR